MNKKRYIFLKIFVFLLCAGIISFAETKTLEGKSVKVVDGDSLEIDGVRIRLKGIDAPEYLQYCFDENKKKYECGKMSREYLEELTQSEDFYCKSNEKDKYKRELSVCYAEGKDINELMIKQGWAIPYRTKNPLYYEAQTVAKTNKSGMHRGKFIAPEIYRRLNKRKKVKN